MKTRAPRKNRDAKYEAFSWRKQGTLLTALSAKTVKGEELGWVTGIMYLQPHTLESDKTLCPFSTEACRRDCLVTSGRGGMPRAQHARTTRTQLFNDDRDAFMATLAREIMDLQVLAARSGRSLAIRLNGTSDILWEREPVVDAGGQTLMQMFPSVQFYDYTKIPIERRPGLPANYHLTYSLADDNWDQAVDYLMNSQSVAAIILEDEKVQDGGFVSMDQKDVTLVDGDLHDLRFLDPPGSLVQIRPKGTMKADNPMVKPRLIRSLMQAAIARSVAAA